MSTQPPSLPDEATLRARTTTMAPVVWLLGRTGSGKSSIVATLTGTPHATIGNGFTPCTRSAQVHDFPPEAPLIRFLDTRGLDEAGYDPTEDLQVNARQAHVLLVVVRASDTALDALLSALHRIRQERPDWPMLVAQTHLHDLYDRRADHPAPYPFAPPNTPAPDAPEPRIAPRLAAALHGQRAAFARLPGPAPRFVPVDFTRPDDGYSPPDYGHDALIQALLEVAPEPVQRWLQGHQLALGEEASKAPPSADPLWPRARSLILYYAATAAGTGALPLVGLGTVPATMASMLWHLCRLYGIAWKRQTILKLFGMLGLTSLISSGIALLVRQVAKTLPVLIPAGAAQDFVATYALGSAACTYLAALQRGEEPDRAAIRAAWTSGLAEAFRQRRGQPTATAPDHASGTAKRP